MIKKGKVYHNLMVDVQPTNKKLIERSKNIIAECTNSSVEEAEKALIDSGNQVKVAILMLLTKKDKKSCINILNENDGNISKSIRNIP